MFLRIDRSQFVATMQASQYHSFSCNGLSCLFDLIEEIEWETGQQIELDPVALRCQFVEYADFHAIFDDYSNALDIDENIADLDYIDGEQAIQNALEIAGVHFVEFDTGVILDVESF